MRTIEPVDQFTISKGTPSARSCYVVVAPEPPFTLGEEVLFESTPHTIVQMECQPTIVPKYVINGHQGLILKPLETP